MNKVSKIVNYIAHIRLLLENQLIETRSRSPVPFDFDRDLAESGYVPASTEDYRASSWRWEDEEEIATLSPAGPGSQPPTPNIENH